MSVTIGPQAVTDEYTDANPASFDFQGTPFAWGYAIVSDAPVWISLLVGTSQGARTWSIDYPANASFVPVSAGSARGGQRPGDSIMGIRFRNFTPGTPATVTGSFFQAGETGIVPGVTGNASNPFSGSLEVTDGIVDVNPTTKIFVGAGLVLQGPGGGQAIIGAAAPTMEVLASDPGSQTFLPATPRNFTLSHFRGSVLMDLTAPAAPKFLASGWYSLSAVITWDPSVAGVLKYARWGISRSSIAVPTFFADGVLVLPAGDAAATPVSDTEAYAGDRFNLGESIAVTARNGDVAAHDFDVFVTIVKLWPN